MKHKLIALTGLYLALVISLFGCSEQIRMEEITYDAQNIGARTKDEALNEAIHVWQEIHEQSSTKSTNLVPKIDDITLISTPRLIFKSSRDDRIDSLAYLINFEDSSGFALVRINKERKPIIAITESGHLNAEKLLNEEACFNDDTQKFIYNILNSALENSKYPLLEEEEDENILNDKVPDNEDIVIGEWYLDTLVGPLLKTKWGQEYPFNIYMPILSDTLTKRFPSYKGHYAAGCVMVAFGQMLVANKSPLFFDGYRHRFYTPSLESVSNYLNYYNYYPFRYDTQVTNRNERAMTENVADMLHKLSVLFQSTHTDTTIATGASCTTAFEQMAILSSRYGSYKEWPYGMTSYHVLVNECLDQGKPVIILGYRENSTLKSTTGTELVGHAWVIDGYLRRHVNYSPAHSRTENLLHFNWGYRGAYDGYFEGSSIGIKDRVQRDSTYDKNSSSTTGVNREYTINTKYYTY